MGQRQKKRQLPNGSVWPRRRLRSSLRLSRLVLHHSIQPMASPSEQPEAGSSSSSAAAAAAASPIDMVEYKKDGTVSRMRSHRGNVPQLPQTKLCPFCPAKFTRTTHLNRHLRNR